MRGALPAALWCCNPRSRGGVEEQGRQARARGGRGLKLSGAAAATAQALERARPAPPKPPRPPGISNAHLVRVLSLPGVAWQRTRRACWGRRLAVRLGRARPRERPRQVAATATMMLGLRMGLGSAGGWGLGTGAAHTRAAPGACADGAGEAQICGVGQRAIGRRANAGAPQPFVIDQTPHPCCQAGGQRASPSNPKPAAPVARLLATDHWCAAAAVRSTQGAQAIRGLFLERARRGVAACTWCRRRNAAASHRRHLRSRLGRRRRRRRPIPPAANRRLPAHCFGPVQPRCMSSEYEKQLRRRAALANLASPSLLAAWAAQHGVPVARAYHLLLQASRPGPPPACLPACQAARGAAPCAAAMA